MAETSQPNNELDNSNSSRTSPSAQQPRNDFAELESSLPPLPDIGRSLPLHGPLDLDQGVSPRDVNPLAASLALALNMSTPVPAPIDRFSTIRPPLAASAWNLFPSGQRTPASPPLIPIPSENRQESSAVPMEGVVSTRQYDLTKAMLDQQWALFVVAQEARDFNLMRMVLNQAIASQDLLTNLVGREEMLRVSENWVARERTSPPRPFDVGQLGQPHSDPVPNQAGPPAVPTSSHPSANPNHAGFHHHNPRPAIPANRPQRELRPTPEIQYLGRTHSATRERLPPPPPPSNPPPTSLQVYQTQPVTLRPTMAPQTYADPLHQPHYGYQEYQYQYHQPHMPHPNQNQHPHPYAPHHHQGGGNRGPGRRQTDPTTRMVRMGESFNRVERILARTSRIRGRERRQQNQPYPQYQNQGHPQ
ncbi:hypothetical protein PSHT_09722 [Puccinia striiformis]|uniref:Uncharacterized protein n=1 Tax=Puccinia striiformis TaxID=27350 RepID=A0A2S4VEZ8_9BASI|nr:hypothetical protein PSHT_09722 [Puccinia striiformis]